MTQPPTFPRILPRVVIALTILVAALVIILIAHTIVAYSDYPFDSDEAIHANSGLALALDLRAGDWATFIRRFYQQSFYPPAFSVLKALTFAALGPSTLAARGFSLACLPLALLAIYLTSRQVDEQWGWLIGCITIGLTLTAQPLLVTSAQVMMEIPGLLASFGMMWLYTRALNNPSAKNLAGTSVMLAITFLTKYTYGVAAIATVGLMEMTLFIKNPTRTARRWWWLIGPCALLLALWFAHPSKLASFWAYATAQPKNQTWQWDSLLFYPRSIAYHYTPSPIFGLITLLSILWTIKRWHHQPLRLLLIYFGVGFIEMTLNLPNDPRFIATFIPAAHILTGAMLAWSIKTWSQANPGIFQYLVAALLIVSLITAVPVLIDRYRAYPSLMEAKYETHPRLNDLADWIQTQTASSPPPYLVNYWDQFGPWALTWYRGTHQAPPGARFQDLAVPASLLIEASDENIAALRASILESGAGYVVAFEGAPWGAPDWWIYAAALDDIIDPVARQVFDVKAYNTGDWLDTSLLRKTEWERIKADSRYTLHVQTTIYAIHPAAP